MSFDASLDAPPSAPRAGPYKPLSSSDPAPAIPVFGNDDSACLHDYFDAAVRRWPNAVAVDVPPGPGRPQRILVSYQELDHRAEAIATHLAGLVVGECIVAILLPRDSELLYAAQLAVLRTGAAYVCIDPVFPDERVDILLADCEPIAVLTDAAGSARLRGRVNSSLVVDALALCRQPPTPESPRVRPAWLTDRSLAYVIYTSGTTGTPKGVLIEHRSIANLVASDRDRFGLGPGDRVAQNSSSSYDSSVEEIWLALAVGATLVVMDDAAVRLGPDLVDWLRRERITVFCPAPTMLRATGCRDPERALPDVRLVYVGGEHLTRDLAERWVRGRHLENGYGPTECAVTVTRTRIHPDEEISIGVPIRGVSAWVLNDALEEVADGEEGELCIGGVSLARGYHNRPELTAERFPVHPRLGRIYRTGDLAHRAPDGMLFVHGRVDSQVKLRGYRVELEEIEARLAQCDGVREAACTVQGAGAARRLTAFVVPERSDARPDEKALREVLRKTLPEHMVPSRIGCLASFPRTVGGKLNRRALPSLDVGDDRDEAAPLSVENPLVARIAAIFGEALEASAPVSATADFFVDLGGDSISAAFAISWLRDDPATETLTVRDLYDHPTAARLAALAAAMPNVAPDDPRHDGSRHGQDAAPPNAGVNPRTRRPIAATLFQSVWLVKDFVIASLVSYVTIFRLAPFAAERLGAVLSFLLMPPLALLGLGAYAILTVAFAVRVKRTLIGRYTPVRVPVWSRYYLKHWVVERAAAQIPWWLLQGTEYQKMALRALGAKIGQRVHIHRGVDLEHGGWDLLDIGDDVTLSQNAAVRLVELDAGEMIIGPVTLGNGCTLDVQAGVRTHCCIEPEGFLGAHSSLPRGGRIPRRERWAGIPARRIGGAPPVPMMAGQALSPVAAGNALLLARLALTMFVALPGLLLAAGFWRLLGQTMVSETRSGGFDLHVLLGASTLAVLAVPLTLVMEAVACRAMGRVRTGVMSRWSLAYLRVWLKPGLVDSAERWLYGTLFWPYWLRLAGATVGRNCEISSLIDALPETIDIGSHTFCADGIYLGGARVHRGSVTIEPVSLASRVFVGNGAVIPAGCRVPEETLLGINTVAEEQTRRPRTAWFGNPPFQLPRRQIVETDPRLTDHPSAIRFANRITWELLRFSLAVGPTLAILGYFEAIERAERTASWPLLLATVILATAGAALFPVFLAIATKWILLGRVRPGVHPLWSCWSSRWDFYCVIWNVYVGGLSGMLRGTALLAVLLRAVGARIGQGVVLGGRVAEDLPDPDMLAIEDGVTFEGSFQAHTFEDRVLKNDRIVVRAGATVAHNALLLYGAEIGPGARLGPHSVAVKYERLTGGGSYEGFPPRRAAEALAS